MNNTTSILYSRCSVNGYRAPLEHLERLTTKDQGLKKKRIWKRDKDNGPALLHSLAELSFQGIDSYLSVMKAHRDLITEKLLETLLEEVKIDGKDHHQVISLVEQGPECSIEWADLIP